MTTLCSGGGIGAHGHRWLASGMPSEAGLRLVISKGISHHGQNHGEVAKGKGFTVATLGSGGGIGAHGHRWLADWMPSEASLRLVVSKGIPHHGQNHGEVAKGQGFTAATLGRGGGIGAHGHKWPAGGMPYYASLRQVISKGTPHHGQNHGEVAKGQGFTAATLGRGGGIGTHGHRWPAGGMPSDAGMRLVVRQGHTAPWAKS